MKGEAMICKTSTNFEFSKNYQRNQFEIGLEELQVKLKKFSTGIRVCSLGIALTCDIEEIDFYFLEVYTLFKRTLINNSF